MSAECFKCVELRQRIREVEQFEDVEQFERSDLLGALVGLLEILERSGMLRGSRMGHQLLDKPAAVARAAIARARGSKP